MEGVIYRRRENLDWLWTERYLVLRAGVIMCFKNKGDPSPLRLIPLNRDCFVTSVKNTDGKYFEFKLYFSGSSSAAREGSISSAKSDSSYAAGRSITYATKSEEETQRWVRAIDEHLQRLRYVEAEEEQEKAPQTARGLEYTPAQIQNILSKRSAKMKRQPAEGAEPDAAGDDASDKAGAGEDAGRHGLDFLRAGEWELDGSESGIALYRHTASMHLSELQTKHAEAYNRLVWNSACLFVMAAIGSRVLLPRIVDAGSWAHILVAVVGVLAYVYYSFGSLLIDPNLPQYLASVTVRGTPSDVFRELTAGADMHWTIPFPNGQELEQVNQYASVCYHQMAPVWMRLAYSRPRDMVVLRYWRQEEDGSFFVIFQSTTHQKAPPRPGYVRAKVPLSSIIIIPQRPEKSGRGNPQSLITVLMGFEPNGWGSVWMKYMNSKAFLSTVIDSLVGFRDKMARLDFIDPHLTVEPSPQAQAAVGVDDQGLVVGVKTLPCSCPQQFWAEPDGSRFEVRGPTYLKDRKKVPAGPSEFHLVAVDMLSFEDPSQRYNLGARPDNIVADVARRAKEAGTPVPFTFIVNMVIPCALNLAVVCYFQPAKPTWREESSGFLDLFSDFIDGDDTFRNNRFKLIPTIVEGNFLVKKALGSRPAIIGNKGLRVPYYRGENWFEVDIDVDSDSQARNITGLVIGATKTLVVDIAFLIEAQSEEELPERILGTVRFNYVDTSICKRIPKDAPTTGPAVAAGTERLPLSRQASPIPTLSVTEHAEAPVSAPESPPSAAIKSSGSPRGRHIRSLSNTPILGRFSKESRARAASHSPSMDSSMPTLPSHAEAVASIAKDQDTPLRKDVLMKDVNMKDVHTVRKGLNVQDSLRATSDLAHTQVTRDRNHSTSSMT